MQRLRRSFSLDFVNDDTATVFLGDDADHEQSATSRSHHNHHHSLTTDPKCLLVSLAVALVDGGRRFDGSCLSCLCPSLLLSLLPLFADDA